MKKPDLSKLKDILYAHGEKIAVGVCIFLALAFGAQSLLKATSVSRAKNSQKTWEQELRDTHDRINREINAAALNEMPDSTKKMLKKEHYDWDPMKGNFKAGPYLPITDSGNSTKRVNPVPLSIRTGDGNIQVDYIRALALTYDVDPRTGSWQGFDPANGVPPVGKFNPKDAVLVPVSDPVRLAVPVRMVRVTAAFPMKQQLEEFRKALRIATQKEMLDKGDDLPNILGLNVIRYQLNEKDEPIPGKEVEIIKMSQRSKALDDLMRIAIYDRVQPEVMKKYLYNGLFTPLPMLANAKYPKVDLKGFDLEYPPEADPVKVMAQPKEGVKPPDKQFKLPGVGEKRPPFPMQEQPGMNPQAGLERKIAGYRRVDLKKADEPLEKRLFGEPGADINNRHKANDYNITHALGLFPPQIPDGKGGVLPGQRGMGGVGDNDLYFSAWKVEPPMPGVGADGGVRPMPVGGQPMQQPDWDRDALVSFIDPDVLPGETYRYKIQVRIANPNHKFQKVDELAFAALANQPELVIGNSHPKWEYTPVVSIPLEYSLYAGDQQLIDEWSSLTPKKGLPTIDPKLKDMTAFQIHLWAKRERDVNRPLYYDIGDVVIAERIMVRRGDPIGVEAYVKIATWNRAKNALDIPSFRVPVPKGKPELPPIYGAFLNMLATDAVIEGGVRKEVKVPAPVLVDFFGGKRLREKSNVIEEETAVDCLIMGPDGQLFVRNSRVDTDPATPLGQERQERVHENRLHFIELLRSVIGVPAGAPGGPMLPGVKN